MCLAIPGKIHSISDCKFIIEYGSEKREAFASAVDVKVGDYVIVSNKVIVSKISEERAKKSYELVLQNVK